MRVSASIAVFLLSSGLWGCSNNVADVTDPLSRACLDCLSERESKGCAAEYAACEEVRACDEYAFCQLTGRCFERPSGSGCEQELECKRPSASAPASNVDGGATSGESAMLESPRALAAAFERCARTTCAATCGFVK